MNPYHISDDMRWMEERIGHERSKGAYAFSVAAGQRGTCCRFGSDWPGTSAAEYHMHPKYLIHAAVNRTTLNRSPKGAGSPSRRSSVHEALKAYTINNAFAAFEDDIRGSLKAGKLADITVVRPEPVRDRSGGDPQHERGNDHRGRPGGVRADRRELSTDINRCRHLDLWHH